MAAFEESRPSSSTNLHTDCTAKSQLEHVNPDVAPAFSTQTRSNGLWIVTMGAYRRSTIPLRNRVSLCRRVSVVRTSSQFAETRLQQSPNRSCLTENRERLKPASQHCLGVVVPQPSADCGSVHTTEVGCIDEVSVIEIDKAW